MDTRSCCATKGDARRRRRDKRRRDSQPANISQREEMRQRTRGGEALISRGCGGGRVERTRGGGVNTTTSRQTTRDNHGDDEGEGDGDGDGKCRAAAFTGLGERPPSSLRLRLWMRSRQRRRRPWSSRLRLRPRSRQMTPTAATAVSPSSVARLSRRGADYLLSTLYFVPLLGINIVTHHGVSHSLHFSETEIESQPTFVPAHKI